MDRVASQKLTDHAKKVIRKYVKCLVLPDDLEMLYTMLTCSEEALAEGDPTGLCMIFFDVKQTGEPITNPHLKVAPFRKEMYTAIVRDILKARWRESPTQSPGLNSGDMVVLLDGGLQWKFQGHGKALASRCERAQQGRHG